MKRFTTYLIVIICCIFFSKALAFQPFSVNEKSEFKDAFVYGDSKVNNNGMIDCYDEFIFSIEFEINQIHKDNPRQVLQDFLIDMQNKGLEIDIVNLLTIPDCIKQVETPQLIKYSRIPDNIDQLIDLRADLHKNYVSMDQPWMLFSKGLVIITAEV